jgi:hypothetical protein
VVVTTVRDGAGLDAGHVHHLGHDVSPSAGSSMRLAIKVSILQWNDTFPQWPSRK